MHLNYVQYVLSKEDQFQVFWNVQLNVAFKIMAFLIKPVVWNKYYTQIFH